MASRGMPNTTQLASFCARVHAPPDASPTFPPHHRCPYRSGSPQPHYARLFGDRMEQHIYRRPMTVNRRAIVNFDLVICATTRQLHMPIARRNIGMPRQNTFSVFGFFNPDLAKLIKSVGKERVKPGGICWVINSAGLESGNGCST